MQAELKPIERFPDVEGVRIWRDHGGNYPVWWMTAGDGCFRAYCVETQEYPWGVCLDRLIEAYKTWLEAGA